MSKHWRSLFANEEKFIGSWVLEKDGKFVNQVVHIEKFYQDTLVGSMGKENKVVAKLREFEKPMVINRTNFKRLETLFESFDLDQYLNKPITLQVEKVKSPEGLVNSLRFSTRKPVQTLPPIKDEDFDKALEAVKKGSTNLEKLQATRSLTPQQIERIKDVQSK